MKFKIDQNLPAEYAVLLREGGFEANSVDEERLGGADDGVISERVRAERRVVLSLDLGFADIRAYPPQEHSGIVVLRAKGQDKINLISMLRRLMPMLRERSPEGELWIVESDRVRFREY